jgi:hypothetical protein
MELDDFVQLNYFQMGLTCNHAQNLIVRKLFQFNQNVLHVSLSVFQNMAKENIWEFFKVLKISFRKVDSNNFGNVNLRNEK